ncbi:MAG TPA: AMIN domain-containing protein, partial [Terriglobales bacterium]
MFCARVLRVASVAALATHMVAPQQSVAQSRTKTAGLHSVRVTPGEFGPVLDVFATGSLTPKIQTVENPLRLVIDLPGSTLGSARTHIAYRNEQIKGIRVSQYQSSPAVTRIVVDLAAPVLYRWDAAGDHLHIRIRPDDSAQAKPPTVPAFTAGTQPAAVPVA